MFRKWLHDHLHWHKYECKAVVDEFAHEGNLWLKVTDYQWCGLCPDDHPHKMNVEWRVVGPLSQFPLKERPNT